MTNRRTISLVNIYLKMISQTISLLQTRLCSLLRSIIERNQSSKAVNIDINRVSRMNHERINSQYMS
jgi:hypothetical protein